MRFERKQLWVGNEAAIKIIPGRSIKIRPGNVLFGSLAILVVRL